MKALSLLLVLGAFSCASPSAVDPQVVPAAAPAEAPAPHPLELGNFSVSLTVKDLAVSRAFYENLGFQQIGGIPEQNWIILKNGAAIVGLFQGMFEANIMTFNPGWDSAGEELPSYTDVRDLQRTLKQRGVSFVVEADEGTTGPASFIITDPDGNTILVDQHVE